MPELTTQEAWTSTGSPGDDAHAHANARNSASVSQRLGRKPDAGGSSDGERSGSEMNLGGELLSTKGLGHTFGRIAKAY
jgi:hypothetical protein